VWQALTVLVIAVPVLGLQVLFALRTRRFLLSASPENRFWNPNLTWGSVVPNLNLFWVPLTVLAVRRTAAREQALRPVLADAVLAVTGRLLTYFPFAIIAIDLAERILVPEIDAGAVTVDARAALDTILFLVRAAVWVLIAASLLSLLGYTVRIKRHLRPGPTGTAPASPESGAGDPESHPSPSV
jgi:hypothetical protein